MSKSPARGETVLVSANLAGQVIITPAATHKRTLDRIGLDADQRATAAQGSGELDSTGRLRLPADIAAFLRPKGPGAPRQ